MSKTAQASVDGQTQQAGKKSFTAWEVFEKLDLVPVTLDCQAYKPLHQTDWSCHTHLKPTADTISRHTEAGHGGAFQVYVRQTEGKSHPLWKELSEAGLEAADFRCSICHELLKFTPSSLPKHLRPHAGVTRQAYNEMKGRQPKAIGEFSFTIGSRVSEYANSDEE